MDFKKFAAIFFPIILLLSVVLSANIAYEAGKDAGLAMNKTSTSIEMPDGRIVNVPFDREVTLSYRSENINEGRELISKKEGEAEGGSARGSSAVGMIGGNLSAPKLDMNEQEGEAGSTGFSAEIKRGASSGPTIMVVVGLAMIIGSIAYLIFAKNFKNFLIIGGAGGAILATGLLVSAYPWVLLVGAAALIGVVIYLIYIGWRSGRIQEAFGTVVNGVENVPDITKQTVKKEIKKEAGKNNSKVKKEVEKMKS